MSNPFPGMNPYLENRNIQGGVHHCLIYAIMQQINQSIVAPLFARIEERLYLVETFPTSPRQRFRADVAVVEPSPYIRPSVGTAVLERVASVQAAHSPVTVRSVLEEVREPYIEIVSVDNPVRVITVIEVLSPTNKTIGDGYEEYRRKQRSLLRSESHLVEIDLLRAGQHTVSANAEDLQELFPLWHYLICVHRAGSGNEIQTWVTTLREPLPTITIPLGPDYADVSLDVQSAVERTYADGFFERSIDYTADPVPPFAAEDAVWADQLLREKGLRPS